MKDVPDKQHSTLYLGIHLLKQYPYHSFVVLASLLIAGILEVIGAATLLPLLSVVGNIETATSKLYQAIIWVFHSLRLSLDLNTLLMVIITLTTLKALFSLLAMRNVGYAFLPTFSAE